LEEHSPFRDLTVEIPKLVRVCRKKKVNGYVAMKPGSAV